MCVQTGDNSVHVAGVAAPRGDPLALDLEDFALARVRRAQRLLPSARRGDRGSCSTDSPCSPSGSPRRRLSPSCGRCRTARPTDCAARAPRRAPSSPASGSERHAIARIAGRGELARRRLADERQAVSGLDDLSGPAVRDRRFAGATASACARARGSTLPCRPPVRSCDPGRRRSRSRSRDAGRAAGSGTDRPCPRRARPGTVPVGTRPPST